MENGEAGHLEAEEERRNANLKVGVGDSASGFEDAVAGCEERDENLIGKVRMVLEEIFTERVHTVCQKERKMTSLIDKIFKNG